MSLILCKREYVLPFKMETPNVEKSVLEMDLLESIRSTLLSCIKDNGDDSNIDHVSIIKRNKELSKGDFVLIAKGNNAKKGSASCHSFSIGMSKVFQTSKEFQVIPQKGPSECFIKLQRSSFYRKVLNQVMKCGNSYGNVEGGDRKVALNCVLPPGEGLECLRCLFLAEHIGNLLQNTGCIVSTTLSTLDRSWLEDFNIQLVHVLGQESHPKENVVMEQLQQSPYRHKEGSGDSLQNDIVLDMKKFMTERKVMTGKDGYDKNLQLIKMNDSLLPRLCDVSAACEESDVCVHVVSAGQEYTQQQVDLVWQVLNTASPCTQHHQVAGSVSARKSGASISLPTVEQFLRIRHEQMVEAAKLKYGEQVTGSGWMDTIMALTVAGIKFEFLSTSCRSQLKLDLCSGGPVDSGGGVFVMYNYARLATLQDKFKQAVDEGIYPDIPSEETLDFSVLKDEEEWSLLFNYILAYPSLLKDCVADLRKGKLRGAIHSHKVCHFLSDLSRELSSYYRRVRILMDPRPHLFPIMHCRLYLMRAVQRVMEHALLLLGIQPISQL